MKRSIFLILFLLLALISFSSEANTATFTVIDSFFQINGETFDCFNHLDRLNFFMTSHNPLRKRINLPVTFYDDIGEITVSESSASFNEVYTSLSSWGPIIVDGVYNGTASSAFASAEIFFRPNFRGQGTPIEFFVGTDAYGGSTWARIMDLTFARELFYEFNAGDEYPWFPLQCDWNPSHIYSLKMSAGSLSVGDLNGASVSHNMEFSFSVPEPGTLLLLGAGLMGVASYRRVRFKA